MKTSKWTQSQIDMLLEKSKDGNVRMHAFEEVAKATGRKPNSVRNFYYKLISEKSSKIKGHNKQSFSPFSASDTSSLLREIILGMSRGESVRAICLKMAGGNKSKMLRLQNKYRAVLAKKPKRIEDMVQFLRDRGYLVNSPIKRRSVNFQTETRSIGGVSQSRIRDDSNIIFMKDYNDKKLSDTDINNLFMGLVRLIKRSAGEEQTYNLRQQISYLKAEIENLKKNKGETENI